MVISALGGVVVLRGGIRSACSVSSRAVSGEARLAGLVGAGIRVWVRLRGRVGGGGCIVIAEFGVEGLHFLHADIVGCTQFEFVHRDRWVEVDVVGEGAGL